MDESWRAPIGSVVPPRRSAEQMRRTGGSLGTADFRDVFGERPRSVLLHQFSCVEAVASASPFGLHGDRNKYWLRPPRSGLTHHARKEEELKLPDFALVADAGVGRWVVGREGSFYDTMRPRQSKTRLCSYSVVSSEDDGHTASHTCGRSDGEQCAWFACRRKH